MRMLSVFAGFVAGILSSASVGAQEYGPPTTNVEVNQASEEVTITAPPRPPTRNSFGAPIQDVSMSIPVSIGDLNLHSGEGVYELRQRVRNASRSVCNRLAFRFPIGTPDHRTCYRRTIRDVMPQADAAIANFRS
ncbi:MAG TPA: UrcA family protein [Rhizomicrobium sp.]|nr:UrcA family protein [Rhizomicrobium sp.]